MYICTQVDFIRRQVFGERINKKKTFSFQFTQGHALSKD
jgi:hypothetical protein